MRQLASRRNLARTGTPCSLPSMSGLILVVEGANSCRSALCRAAMSCNRSKFQRGCHASCLEVLATERSPSHRHFEMRRCRLRRPLRRSRGRWGGASSELPSTRLPLLLAWQRVCQKLHLAAPVSHIFGRQRRPSGPTYGKNASDIYTRADPLPHFLTRTRSGCFLASSYSAAYVDASTARPSKFTHSQLFEHFCQRVDISGPSKVTKISCVRSRLAPAGSHPSWIAG